MADVVAVAAPKRKNVSRSKRAHVLLPIGRVARMMKGGKLADRVSGNSPVYLTAVLQSLLSDVLDLAGKEAIRNKRKKITPRYIQLAVRNDAELRDLLGSVTIGEGGVLPNVGGKKKK